MASKTHMNPMMQFSKRLASKGIRIITLVASSDLRGSIITTTSMVHIEYMSYEFDEDEKPYNMQSYMAFVKHKVRNNLTRLIHKQSISGHSVKFLVFDSLYPGGVEMSHELDLKGAPFFTQSCAVGAIYYHVQLICPQFLCPQCHCLGLMICPFVKLGRFQIFRAIFRISFGY